MGKGWVSKGNPTPDSCGAIHKRLERKLKRHYSTHLHRGHLRRHPCRNRVPASSRNTTSSAWEPETVAEPCSSFTHVHGIPTTNLDSPPNSSFHRSSLVVFSVNSSYGSIEDCRPVRETSEKRARRQFLFTFTRRRPTINSSSGRFLGNKFFEEGSRKRSLTLFFSL